jgi:hypothetical protein
MGKSLHKALKIGLNDNPDARITIRMSNDTNGYAQAILKPCKPFVLTQWITYKETI